MYVGLVDLFAYGAGFESFAVGTGSIWSFNGSGTSATGALQLRLAAPQRPEENTYVRAGTTIVVVVRLEVVIWQWVHDIQIAVAGSVVMRIVASTGPTTISPTSPKVTEMVLAGPYTASS